MVKYIWDDGIILSANDGKFHLHETCHPGDVIGCLVHQQLSNQPYHRVSFSRNGIDIGHPIYFEGHPPISFGLLKAVDSEGPVENDVFENSMTFRKHPFDNITGNTIFSRSLIG